MSNFSISNFISEVNIRGLARPNRFEVFILPPPGLGALTGSGRLVSLLCESASLPAMSISTKPYRIYGASYQRPVSSEFNGDGITLSFYIDNKMEVKSFFDAWMFKVVNPNSFNVSYQREYVSQIKIAQLDEKNNENYSIYLEDAFPRAVNMLDLNMGSTNQVHKLNVTFAYRRWFSESEFLNRLRFDPAGSGIDDRPTAAFNSNELNF
jgi:hypothetical protein